MDNEAPRASTAPILTNETNTEALISNDVGDHYNSELVFGCQTKPDLDTFAVQTTVRGFRMTEENRISGKEDNEEFCQIKLDSLLKLKDSTRKLLYLIERIQFKTHSAVSPTPIRTATPSDSHSLAAISEMASGISDLLDPTPLKKLEAHAKNLDVIVVESIDDCSVFKRLTRKCHCLNRKEFNDFMIHFNEDTKYCTSNLGEIIKNLRILKKFLYMGDGYTKNALIFLNEGLTKSPHSEKVDIVLAISHADLCNVFDNESFVTTCIMWPNKYEAFGDSMTQSLAARVLYRIAVVEEGRRYLNFNSKITNDTKRIIRKLSSNLDPDTLEFLNSTLNLLNPAIVPLINSTYYCKADEGLANRVLNALTHFRYNMTLEEVNGNLNILNQMSNVDKGKRELRSYLPHVFKLFKHILMDYDCTEINMIVTSILNNLTSKVTNVITNGPTVLVVNNTATEPIEMKNQFNQAPQPPRGKIKSFFRNKIGINSSKPIPNHLSRQNLTRRGSFKILYIKSLFKRAMETNKITSVGDWETMEVEQWREKEPVHILSVKPADLKSSIIVVPYEK